MKIRHNRTKIMATVGPAIDNEEMLMKMVEAGVNVFRLNFSHGDHENKAKVIEMICNINERLNDKIGILADLQGPKLRIGKVEGDTVELEEGKELTVTTRQLLSTAELLSITYENFARDVSPGERVLMDDGKLELEVLSTDSKTEVQARVIVGGPLSGRKGVNLPNTRISVPSLTDKDKEDLRFILDQDVQWIALSFVRTADDLKELKGIVNYHGKDIKLIAKVERPEAVQDLEHIVDAADGIMIARGDLGVEVPMEQIPIIQKRIIQLCLSQAKPVVIATQMMESMITNSRPTRAEVTDVANGVMEGADTLMLSGETSVGRYPVRVIEMMQKIITRVESETTIYNKGIKPKKKSPTYLSDAVCYTAVRMAEDVGAQAIMGMTRSGYTAFMISRNRPQAEIFIFTDSEQLRKQMSLIWGVRTFYYNHFVSTDQTIAEVKEILKKYKLIKTGDIVINTGSMPLAERGRTNMLKISITK